MGMDAGTPPGLVERIRLIVAEEVRKFARSGFLRNASISDGGLTIKGGWFRLLSKVTGGVEQFYLGPIGDVLGNGERQQFWRVRRADGSAVLMLWDAFPDPDGTLNQALSWMDRSGHTVLADDTDSGFGLARPYVPGAFYKARYTDWVFNDTNTFQTIYRAELFKQQPRLSVAVMASSTAPDVTGEVRVLVNGQQWGGAQAVPWALNTLLFGPEVVSGTHMQLLTIEIQARLARVEPLHMYGRQT